MHLTKGLAQAKEIQKMQKEKHMSQFVDNHLMMENKAEANKGSQLKTFKSKICLLQLIVLTTYKHRKSRKRSVSKRLSPVVDKKTIEDCQIQELKDWQATKNQTVETAVKYRQLVKDNWYQLYKGFSQP